MYITIQTNAYIYIHISYCIDICPKWPPFYRQHSGDTSDKTSSVVQIIVCRLLNTELLSGRMRTPPSDASIRHRASKYWQHVRYFLTIIHINNNTIIIIIIPIIKKFLNHDNHIPGFSQTIKQAITKYDIFIHPVQNNNGLVCLTKTSL